jgi:UDP-galactopyranose mutase
MSKHVLILGGGLAGLSCAYEMAKAGIRVTVLEREPVVGGMANSFEEGDRATAGEEDSDYWCFDYGPHRFHTKEKELLKHVQEVLGDNKVWANRLSRIVLFGKFFDYPLQAKNILKSLNPFTILACMLDYSWVRFLEVTRIRRLKDRNFAEWVTRRFGKRLARIFFVQYTEQGLEDGPGDRDLRQTGRAQRITLLNLLRHRSKKTLRRPGKAGDTPRTLVTELRLSQARRHRRARARLQARKIEEMGGTVR